MKIALVCTEMLPVPCILGGAIQIYIDGILPIISKFHDITMYSVLKGGLPKKNIDNNITYVRFQGETDEEYIKNVKKHISANKYDLIHVFNRPKWISDLSSVISDTPLSLSLHNEMMLPKVISSSEALKCIDRVSFITTISKFIGDELINMYPSAKSKVYPIYSAVDLEKIKPIWSLEAIKNKESMIRKYGLDGYKIVLCVSRLDFDKGQHVLIEAMQSVIKSHPYTALILVGSKWYGDNEIDDYTRNLKASARKLKCPAIFTGFLTPAQVPEYYNMADIFVCASQWREPLARIHFEAMAAGLPIITTNRGGNAEVFKQEINGLVIYEYDNAKVMAEKIIYLLENPDVALKMGKSARKIAEEKFNFNRTADELLKLFESVQKN
jgi:spore coat protein SA